MSQGNVKPIPTSIRIFLADGEPDGIRVVDKSNWTGRAVMASRAQLGEALLRDEMARPGVYTLIGPGEGSASRIYVGEADELRERLKTQGVKKDFWTQMIAFSSTDESLNKAYVRYLEHRLVGLAKKANQWEVDNSTTPAQPPLSEADRADAEWFLREMLILYPILGVDAFEVAHQAAESEDQGPALFLRERGADGRGLELKDGFLVRQGSRGRVAETKSIHAYMKDLRAQLLEKGVMVKQGDKLVFQQDYRFSSPSTAAGVLVGGAANGRQAWKTSSDTTLKSIQDSRAQQGA